MHRHGVYFLRLPRLFEAGARLRPALGRLFVTADPCLLLRRWFVFLVDFLTFLVPLRLTDLMCPETTSIEKQKSETNKLTMMDNDQGNQYMNSIDSLTRAFDSSKILSSFPEVRKRNDNN